MSGIRPPVCSRLAKNPRNDNDVTIFRHDVIVKFFGNFFVFLVKFSYWSKFQVNIITGSGIMTILFYKGLTRNPEIGNTPSGFCPISGDRGKLWIPNLARMFLVEYYWMLQGARGYRFYRFWVIKEKPTGGGCKITNPPPFTNQIRIKTLLTNDLSTFPVKDNPWFYNFMFLIILYQPKNYLQKLYKASKLVY